MLFSDYTVCKYCNAEEEWIQINRKTGFKKRFFECGFWVEENKGSISEAADYNCSVVCKARTEAKEVVRVTIEITKFAQGRETTNNKPLIAKIEEICEQYRKEARDKFCLKFNTNW